MPAQLWAPLGWSFGGGAGGSGGFVGHTLTVNLNSIAGGNTTTVLVNATTPTTLGVYCNQDNATFNPFRALTYFQGNQTALTTHRLVFK